MVLPIHYYIDPSTNKTVSSNTQNAEEKTNMGTMLFSIYFFIILLVIFIGFAHHRIKKTSLIMMVITKNNFEEILIALNIKDPRKKFLLTLEKDFKEGSKDEVEELAEIIYELIKT